MPFLDNIHAHVLATFLAYTFHAYIFEKNKRIASAFFINTVLLYSIHVVYGQLPVPFQRPF
jgi:hypothetical protein